MKKKASRKSTAGGGFGPGDMDRLLRQCKIELPQNRLQILWQYHNLLRRYNPELNLTRIHSFENMVLKLYADSILPAGLIELPSPLLDVGTGAGMPGIPLKTARPDIEIVLAESRGNRVEFLKKAIAELALSGISVYGHAVTPDYEEPFDAIITRAVEHMGKTLERVHGCLSRGGLAVFMKGPECEEEISETKEALKKRYRLARDIAYKIPQTPHQRRLVVFERTDHPPRRQKEKAMEKHRLRVIESENNQTFRDLKKLLTGKGVKKQNRAIISGAKLIEEITAQFGRHCLAWISEKDRHPPPEALPGHTAWYQLEPKLFQTLDVIGTNNPLLLIKTPEIAGWDPAAGLPEGLSLLVPFQDPENVGTVIRSAAAFGADRVILLAESAHPFHPRAVRASGGAVMHVSMMQGPSIQELPEDLPVIALSAEGTPISEFDFPGTFGLLPGLEGSGVPARLRQTTISIPIRPEIESLNAAAATAIALYAWSQSVRL
ncbi:MAG: 16S rRNA (guanine(527)-N(7))-methyltransferase RsmG [Desulfobacteraceae bacterium]|nr:16S rRNA (guanine(527)-N(7))-methyltransferase RsmG [Desulfobacteraceae bacterium]